MNQKCYYLIKHLGIIIMKLKSNWWKWLRSCMHGKTHPSLLRSKSMIIDYYQFRFHIQSVRKCLTFNIFSKSFCDFCNKIRSKFLQQLKQNLCFQNRNNHRLNKAYRANKKNDVNKAYQIKCQVIGFRFRVLELLILFFQVLRSWIPDFHFRLCLACIEQLHIYV